MLFAHFLITNYRDGKDHPILDAITHWLFCAVLQACIIAGLFILFLLIVLLVGAV